MAEKTDIVYDDNERIEIACSYPNADSAIQALEGEE